MSHVNDAVRLVGASPVDFGLVTAVDHQRNVSTTTPETGAPYDPQRRVQREEPTVTWETEAIKQVLDEIPLSGLCIAAGKPKTALRYYANKLDACGTEGRTDADENLMAEMIRAQVYLQSLKVSQESAAVASLIAHAMTTSAKGNPITQVYDQAMQTPVTTGDGILTFGLYGFDLLGSALEDIADVSIEYSPDVKKPPVANGTRWPSKLYAAKFRQTVKLNLNDPTILDRILTDNIGQATQANTELQLVQLNPDGSWVDPTATSHIKIPIKGTAYQGTAYQKSGDELSSSDLTIESFGTTAPLLHNTGVALE